jgi:hypothetical protein
MDPNPVTARGRETASKDRTRDLKQVHSRSRSLDKARLSRGSSQSDLRDLMSPTPQPSSFGPIQPPQQTLHYVNPQYQYPGQYYPLPSYFQQNQ